ncbi:MAG: L-2-keto-3-deoxyarabonate dehydratase [Firmicutes bacterium ADurb.Bin262]|nr:MAG: L-2-keto-3-deoxyarabonate dehydratase [Firmicutes bacterium ADurb.Bin262]
MTSARPAVKMLLTVVREEKQTMKKQFAKFYGMMPILPTPVDAEGDIDREDIVSLVGYCVGAGAVAVGHLAGASEYAAVGREDRETIIRCVVEAAKGKLPVFIGAAACSVQDSVYNAKAAQDLGADMIMLCSPPYGSGTPDEVFAFYERVCGAVNLPVIVQDTGGSWEVFTPDFLIKLYHEIENIGYVKAEGGHWLEKMRALMLRAPEGMQIIGGAAGKNMMQMLDMGVTAFMTGTEAQEIHRSVVDAYLSGDREKAALLYRTTLLPYLELYCANNYNKALKHMLKRRGIIKNDALLYPRVEANPVSEYLLGELDRVLGNIEKDEP